MLAPTSPSRTAPRVGLGLFSVGLARRPDRRPEHLKAKILIVGGGAMGTCIALAAARRCDPLREPVVLLEKERLGAGSSGRSSAILHQAYGDRALAGMARDALKNYSGLQSTTGRSVGYRRTGALILAGPAGSETARRLEQEVAMQSQIAIDVQLVGAEEIRALVPGIEVASDEIGSWQPAGGFVDPARAIDIFAKLARSEGAVTRIGIDEPRILVEDGRVTGVESAAGTFQAPNVALTAGPWTPGILERLGARLPLTVVKTQECFLRMPSPEVAEEDEADGEGGEFETRFVPDPLDTMPVAHPVLVDLAHGFLARCEPGAARTRIAELDAEPMALESPEALPREVTPELPDWVRTVVARRLPIYHDLELLGSHTSWATLTPDRKPVAGPVPGVEGLFVVAGTTGNDFQLAPSIGEGLAQMILGQPVSAFDTEFLSPSRFA